MAQIIVSDDQARVIGEAGEDVEIRDRWGNHLGYVVHGFTDEDVAIAKRRLASDQPRLTTQQVLEHIHSLKQR